MSLFFWANLCLLELDRQERWLIWCFSSAVTARKFGNQDNWLLQLQSFPFGSFKIPSFDDQVGQLNDPHLVAIENIHKFTAPSCWTLAMNLYWIPLLVKPHLGGGNLNSLYTVHCVPTAPLPGTLSKRYAIIHPSLPYWIFQKLFLCLYTQVYMEWLSFQWGCHQSCDCFGQCSAVYNYINSVKFSCHPSYILSQDL